MILDFLSALKHCNWLQRICNINFTNVFLVDIKAFIKLLGEKIFQPRHKSHQCLKAAFLIGVTFDECSGYSTSAKPALAIIASTKFSFNPHAIWKSNLHNNTSKSCTFFVKNLLK